MRALAVERNACERCMRTIEREHALEPVSGGGDA
jgi:hypothetical protein